MKEIKRLIKQEIKWLRDYERGIIHREGLKLDEWWHKEAINILREHLGILERRVLLEKKLLETGVKETPCE